MKTHEINPFIRVAMPSVLSDSVTIARRIIYDYELICIDRGKFIFEYNGIPYTCGAGTVIFIRPGVQHAFVRILEDLSQPHIHFDIVYESDSEKVPVSFKDFDKMTAAEQKQIREDIFAAYPQDPFLRVSDPERFRDLFYAVVTPKEPDALTRKAKLTELLSLIIADNFPDCFTGTSHYKVEQQIKDFIDAGQGMGFVLDDFEKQFSYDKFYLEKRFKQAFGISLMAYRNEKRMDAARKLLETRSVCDVAAQLGFGSIYSFSRAYKLHFGHAPTKQ